jgi:Glycosyl hydrolases family 31 TIM-barrel domain
VSASPASVTATARRLSRPAATFGSGAIDATRAPTARPTCSTSAASPRAITRLLPWLLASRGCALWLEGEGDGAEFDLGHRVEVSARAAAGPFRLHVLCDPTPAARLRRFLRLTGTPPLLPEWGYGHWKSRDVYEHRSDVEDDFDGYRHHRLPLDAIVLDSPRRPNTTPGSRTRTSSRTSRAWSPASAIAACARSYGPRLG